MGRSRNRRRNQQKLANLDWTELPRDIPGAIFLEYIASEFIQSVATIIPATTGTAQDFCYLKNCFSSLFKMRIGLENVSDESRAFSLYMARSSRLYSSPRADLTYLSSPLNRFTHKWKYNKTP
ncbi:unnamed protein product [Prunus armeniaca]